MKLTEDEQRTLLDLARSAIRQAVLADGSLDRRLTTVERSDGLECRRGLFVTLKREAQLEGRRVERLRGCVGSLEPDRPLVEAVPETAARAAMTDPRFSPLAADELDDLRLSISVLTSPEPLQDVERLIVGEHGVQLVLGDRRAVFLPQVAAEQHWNARELLEHLSLKAGLRRDAWREAGLSVFRAISF